MTAIELVTPDGQLVRATAEDHAELFWALRGGGGNFGIVTAMEFRLFAYGEVYAGMMLALRARRRGAARLARLDADGARGHHDVDAGHALPPLPELPDFLRGRSVAVIDGAFAGEAGPGAEAIAALRALEPELDTGRWSRPWRSAASTWTPRSRCPPSAGSVLRRARRGGAGGLRGPRPARSAADVRRAAPPRRRAARAPEGAGATGSFDGEYLYFTAGIVMGPEMAEAVHAAGKAARAALAPYETGSANLNFVGEPTDPATFYTHATHARLRAIRAAVDPHGLMVANHRSRPPGPRFPKGSDPFWDTRHCARVCVARASARLLASARLTSGGATVRSAARPA